MAVVSQQLLLYREGHKDPHRSQLDISTVYSGPSILRPLVGPRKGGLILQVVLK